MTKNEKFINRNSKNQKKIENFWSQKFRVRHARYRISTPGTRCNQLKNFRHKFIYIVIYCAVSQKFALWHFLKK